MLDKIKSFAVAHAEWIAAGMPLRTSERMIEIYDNICSKCEHFKEDTCTVCGCNIKREGNTLNKLAMATTRCPLEEPKWIEEAGIDNQKKEQDEINPPAPIPPLPKPRNGGCGCH